MNPALEPSEPEEFGPYIVYERLGVGGMAAVHRAKKHGIAGFERSVALKRILSHLAEDAGFVDAFIREAKVASLLQHPNIAQVYDFGRVGGVYFIAMELIAGFDLRKLLRHANHRNEPIPLPVVLSILIELCDALEYAHMFVDEQGNPLRIVHRDVSPSNLIVAHTGHLKVIDFGIAKASSRQLYTDSGKVKGKLGYMSPEAAMGMTIGPASDVFSVGVVAWELLTASPLFSARTDYETMRRIREEEIVPPSRHNPSCPPELDATVLAALDRDPETRLPTAGTLRALLEQVAGRAGGRVSARDVAEWIVRLALPDDVEAGSESTPSASGSGSRYSSPRIPIPSEAPTSNDRGSGKISPPKLVRSDEDVELAAEIWGEDIQAPVDPSHRPDFRMATPQRTPGSQRMPPEFPPSANVAPRSRGGRTAIVAVLLIAMVAAAVAAFVIWQRSSDSTSVSKPATASLRFVIRPEGAIVEIGGKEVGHGSPFETELAPGVYSISVRHDGFRRWSNSITLRDGERQNINVALEPGIAHVAIDSKPRGLAIELDGKPTGYETPAKFDTQPGVHRLKVTNASGEVWSEEFIANIDDTHMFDAELAAVRKQPAKIGTDRTSSPRVKDPVAKSKSEQITAPDAASPPVTPPLEPLETPHPVQPPSTKPAKPARIPVVAANAVTKQSGELPTIKVPGDGDRNGDVLVKMCIDEQGRVTSVKVLKSTAEIAVALQHALQAWRYKPYLNRDNQPSPVCFPLSVRVVVKRAD